MNTKDAAARSKKKSKRSLLQETARTLFFRYGIRKVSIEEICRKTAVSKMTFYRNFPNKNALVMGIVQEIIAESARHFDEILAQDASFATKMEAIIAMKIEMVDEYSKDFFHDLLDDESEAGQFLIKKRREFQERMKDVYLLAQQEGEVRAGVKIEFIMSMSDHLHTFMKNPQLESLYSDPGELMREVCNYYLYGIMARGPEEDS